MITVACSVFVDLLVQYHVQLLHRWILLLDSQNSLVFSPFLSGGRYLGDVWALDIERLQWRPVSCTSAGDDELPSFQPLAGHRLVAWGTTLLCIGGHTKAKQPKRPLTVWCLDTSSMVWSLLEAKGESAPVNRGGHSVALVGSKLYVFGGEDVMRRPLGDLWALDLESWSWLAPEAGGTPPRDRSAHITTVVNDRWMVVFGGGSLAHCFNDLHVLDTEAMEWFQPELGGEGVPSARAGCAGGRLGSKWFIMGGGDNTGGCTDMVALDLTQLPSGGPVSWELVENVGTHSPIACEGMGVVVAPTAALLLTFGGYNGKYHNTLHLYQPAAAVPEADVAAGRVPAGAKMLNGHATAVSAVARADTHHIVAGKGSTASLPGRYNFTVIMVVADASVCSQQMRCHTQHRKQRMATCRRRCQSCRRR